MAGSFVQSWQDSVSANPAVLTVNGATANNYLVGVIQRNRGGDTAPTVPGWTTVYFNVSASPTFSVCVVAKIAEGNSNDNLSADYGVASNSAMLVQEFTGTSTDNPLEASAENTAFITTTTNIIPTNQATSLSNDGINVAVFGTRNARAWSGTSGTGSIDSGFTNYVNEFNQGGFGQPGCAMASKPFTGGVSAENPNFIADNNVAECYAALLVIKSPSAGPVPAVLSDPTTASITQTSATVGCTTDTAGGTMYWYVSTSATPPSIADHKSGVGAVSSGNYVPILGANTASATGLTAGTTYYHHHLQNTVDGDSNQLTSPSFNTLPATATVDPVDLNQAQALDQATLTQAGIIAPNPITQVQILEEPTLTQEGAIVADSITQGQVLEEAILSLGFQGEIGARTISQAQTFEEPTISIRTLLVNDLTQGQFIESANLAVAGTLLANNLFQGQQLEEATLTQNYSITADPITQGQALDQATVAQDVITVLANDITQQTFIETANLVQFSVINPDSLTQGQVLQTAQVGDLTVGTLDAVITFYPALDADITFH